MATLYMMCGLPGAGKTTWTNNFLKEHPDTVKSISRDKIRYDFLRNKDTYFAHEKAVFEKFVEIITQALINDYDIIADATHINKISRMKLIKAIDKVTTDYNIIYVFLNTPVEECVIRNNAREGRERVPDVVIQRMANNFQTPAQDEDNRILEVIEVNE